MNIIYNNEQLIEVGTLSYDWVEEKRMKFFIFFKQNGNRSDFEMSLGKRL